MLLNEVQKDRAALVDQRQLIAQQNARVAHLEAEHQQDLAKRVTIEERLSQLEREIVALGHDRNQRVALSR
jgi:hypothetical protein